MKNEFQKIKIVDKYQKMSKVNFLDSGITMNISNDLLKEKIKSDIYRVISFSSKD